MPRYFFHLSFGQRVVPDEEGVELPNRSAARDEALAVIRDLANPEIGGSGGRRGRVLPQPDRLSGTRQTRSEGGGARSCLPSWRALRSISSAHRRLVTTVA